MQYGTYLRYTDIMELHIIELPKLPAADDGTDLYDWIRFIKAKNKEEFKMLAKENIYLDKAYEVLEEISADQQKRLEYTARQKAVYDYNTLMEENYERGRDKGIEIGRGQGIEIGRGQGIEIGRSQGIEIGKAERDKELISKMRAEGLDESFIRRFLN